jgi:hypothetical protein
VRLKRTVVGLKGTGPLLNSHLLMSKKRVRNERKLLLLLGIEALVASLRPLPPLLTKMISQLYREVPTVVWAQEERRMANQFPPL